MQIYFLKLVEMEVIRMAGIDQDTIVLMHMDNNMFKDSCGNARYNHGVVMDENIKKFGNGSAKFTTGKEYIFIPNISLSRTEFTVDFQVYITSNATGNCINLFGDGRNMSPRCWNFECNINYLRFLTENRTMCWEITCDFSPNTFHHVAVVNDQINVYIFVDGKLVGKRSSWYFLYCDMFAIGQNAKETVFTAPVYIDEFRVSYIARWRSNFTPPTSAYFKNKFLIKQGTQYYTVTSSNYDSITTHKFKPLNLKGISQPNDSDYNFTGFDDINTLVNNMTKGTDINFKPLDKFDTPELRMWKLN